MNTTTIPQAGTHPAIVIAAVAVTAFSLVGIGVATGLIPAHRSADPAPAAVVASAPQAAPVAAPPVAPTPNNGTTISVSPGSTVNVNPTTVHRSDNTPRPHVAKAQPPSTVAAVYPPPPPVGSVAPVAAAPRICNECGIVENVRTISRKGESSGLGAIAGTLLGGAIGHQFGGGRGRDVATVAGAIGGAMAGNSIEQNSRGSEQYQVSVRFDDGTTRIFTQDTPPLWHVGDHVRLAAGALAANY